MEKILMIIYCVCLSSIAVAQVNTDSLWAIWSDESQTVITRLEALKYMHEDEKGMSKPTNPDTAYYHAQLQYELAKKNGLKNWMAEALRKQGNYFNKKGDIKAREYYTQSLNLAEEIEDTSIIAKASYNLGLTYFKKADFQNGFNYFSKAAKSFEAIDNKMMQAYSLDKIALMYAQQQDAKSIDYMKQAIAIREELIKTDSNTRDKMVLAMMKQTLVSLEMNVAIDEGEAIPNEKELEEISTARSKAIDEIGLDTNSPLALSNAATKFLKQGNKIKAKKYFDKSIKASEQEGNNLATSDLLSMTAYSYLSQKDSLSAIPYLEKALNYAQIENELKTIGELSFVLFKTYQSNGNYKKSLEMFQLSSNMRDSIQNMKNAKAVIQQQVQSDYEKQKAIDHLENEKLVAIETQKKKNQQKLSIAIGIGLLLISLLALVIFNRLKVARQQKAIIEEQKKKVEQSEKYKEQFLANMSHEIRTPMHAISGMVKILERNEHPPSQDVFLNAMQTSSENLVVILNDVLDLSKIEAGKLDIESIPMKPAAVIENVMQILKYKAEEKGLGLTHQIAEDVPALVMGDPGRLNQILINLVGNAIKFTEKGSVGISLTKVEDRLRFIIKDTGIGISKDKMESIFEAFEQAKDSTTRNFGGTGLGLSISKQLVELQNGKIWAKSEEGQGSTFYVELPLVAAAVDAIGQDLITADRLKMMTASLKGVRILLAEDNDFNQMIAQDDLSFYIEDLKINVVQNGTLAVEKFQTGNYDLILMDVQMPEMNGFEATQKIRALEKAAGNKNRIPIIAMTASLLKSEIDHCYESGMNNYIPKPYQPEELIAPIYQELKED